jgi:putative ATP-dependent endonuclease of the OLD family
MHLSELKLWNFRKYGSNADALDPKCPDVTVNFNEGLNVLIGENDSGKTAIVDAIRFVLGTQSREWQRLDETDFYGTGKFRALKLRAECVFRGFSHTEAAPFLEWLGFENQNGTEKYVLYVSMTAERRSGRIVSDVRAGIDSVQTSMDAEARELLRVTYLKPLRDAESELTPGRRSRLAQILAAHKLFQKEPSASGGSSHELEKIFKTANDQIEKYFGTDDAAGGKDVMNSLTGFLTDFFPEDDAPTASVNISGGELADILRRLELALGENAAGLGSLNLLYIAAELLLLQSDNYNGLRLGLIEELEAHLHPQAQLRLIHFLNQQSNQGQFILTTHSTTLGSSIDLKSLIVCKGQNVYPMGPAYTMLEEKNYGFLQRFLDATKANLFFARGVILVEGDAENLLVPTIAELIDRPLHRYGVSIVNVGSTAFLHYAKIFQRKDGSAMDVKVALITDMDVKPVEWVDADGSSPTQMKVENQKRARLKSLTKYNKNKTEVFVAPNWTLEYEISLSGQRKRFYRSVLWAEKIENSLTGIPKQEKWDEVKIKRDEDLKQWEEELEGDDRKREIIAYRIYREVMLDKHISKAIAAQKFAESLAAANVENLRKSKHLRHLLSAIYHVTAPPE